MKCGDKYGRPSSGENGDKDMRAHDVMDRFKPIISEAKQMAILSVSFVVQYDKTLYLILLYLIIVFPSKPVT